MNLNRIPNFRRFVSLTSGYASVPSYGGNLRSLSELIKKTCGTRDAWRRYKTIPIPIKTMIILVATILNIVAPMLLIVLG